MDRKIQETITALSTVYAKYFVEDFTNQVIENLGNNLTLTEDVKNEFMQQIALEKFANVTFNLENPNSATKFIYECAEYAVENDIRNADSRAVYEEISGLPSMYHEELNAYAYNASSLYLNTLDKTVCSVIGNDAATAAGTIVNGSKARMESEETGGRVKFFNWGVLSDGLWLNSALVKAYEIAKIFRPGDKISAYFTEVGFSFARNYVTSALSSDTDEAFQLLVTNTPNDILTTLDGPGCNRWNLKSLLFQSGTMRLAIDFWEKSVNRPELLMESVEHLSQLAVVLPAFLETAKKLEAEDLIGSDITQRIDGINTSITLCLAAYEAARETIYADSLVMYVEGEGQEPMVDVFVNQDTVNQYKSAGGEESDLASIGTYLDPRKGMITGKGGWAVDWAINRRSDILNEVTLSEHSRLEKKRVNDKNVIQSMVKDTMMDVVKPYAQATGLEVIPNVIKNKVDDLARKMVSPVALENFNLEAEIVSVLTDVIGDKFVANVADTFVNLATSDNEVYQQNARELTIVKTAFNDACDILLVA